MYHKGKRGSFAGSVLTIIMLMLFYLLFAAAETMAQGLSADKRAIDPAIPGFGPSPTIFTVSPQAGKPGDIVYIYGDTFGSSQEEGEVYFYREPVQVIFWSKDMIVVVVPVDICGFLPPVLKMKAKRCPHFKNPYGHSNRVCTNPRKTSQFP